MALRFRTLFRGYSLTKYATQKVLDMCPAETQGFDANVLKYLRHQSSRVQNPWFKPMIFVAGAPGSDQQCLPLTKENIPERLRGAEAGAEAVGAMVGRGAEGDGVEAGEEPEDDNADLVNCMSEEVQEFLRSCSGADGALALPSGGGGGRRRRRGAKVARGRVGDR